MFSQLIANSNTAQSLSTFISNNSLMIDEFVNSGIENQRKESQLFEEFVLLGSRVQILDSLDFSISQNRAFIAILFDFAERVNTSAAILQLHQIIQRHHLDVGSRLKASMLYLFNIPNNKVLVSRFDDICTQLLAAIEEEDDDDSKAIATFLNYYSSVIYNTAPHMQFAHELQAKALSSRLKYPFLRNEDIINSLSLDISQVEMVYTTIQSTIDKLLGKQKRLSVSSETDFIIESDSDYSQMLAQTSRSFERIRQISVSQLTDFPNRDEIFHSLGRGVSILQQEEQLYSYMNSYGLMHKAKLESAFSHFPFEEIKESNIEIYDWSCGQGIASMVLLEYLRDSNIQLTINKIILIEPSEIALKRASLHVRHFDSDVKIKTVLKDMDSLSLNDIHCENNCIKVHLFSNILDVETFSMQQLLDSIKQTFNGLNYFVCVSPYINDVKTARIDSFVDSFRENNTFKLIHQDIALRGEWTNNWTKLIKVFSLILP